MVFWQPGSVINCCIMLSIVIVFLFKSNKLLLLPLNARVHVKALPGWYHESCCLHICQKFWKSIDTLCRTYERFLRHGALWI